MSDLDAISKYQKYKEKYLELKYGGAGEFISLYGKPPRKLDEEGRYTQTDYFEGRYINENGVHLKTSIYKSSIDPKMLKVYIQEQGVVVKQGGIPYRPTSDIFSISDRMLYITEEEFKHFAENIVNKGINWEIKYEGKNAAYKYNDKYKAGDIIKLPGIWVYNNILVEEKKKYLLETWSEMLFGKKK